MYICADMCILHVILQCMCCMHELSGIFSLSLYDNLPLGVLFEQFCLHFPFESLSKPRFVFHSICQNRVEFFVRFRLYCWKEQNTPIVLGTIWLQTLSMYCRKFKMLVWLHGYVSSCQRNYECERG